MVAFFPCPVVKISTKVARIIIIIINIADGRERGNFKN